jgi:hypothetical protein
MFRREQKNVHVIELSDEVKQALAQLDNDMQGLEALFAEVLANQRRVLAALTGEIARPPIDDEADAEIHDSAPSAQERSTRQRESPFTRRPRHEQVTWLTNILQDGRWHTPLLLAKSIAREPAELRYLKRAIQGRMREMHEEGLLDRRDSRVGGAMFDYKLKR